MTDRQLESLLAEAAAPPAGDPPGPHLHDERCEAAAAGGAPLTAGERAHLLGCPECRTVLALALRAAEAPAPAQRWIPGRRWIVPGLALAAGLLLGLGLLWRGALVTQGSVDDGLRAKGKAVALAAEVTFLATDASGQRRDLRDGDPLGLDERLGFKYGNPEGAHRSLTILGQDAQGVRWYYPEGPEAAPFPVEAGPKALALRLPEDIALAARHTAGPLRVVAAFDADPKALAERLRAGDPLPEGTFEIRVTLKQPAP